MYKRMGFLNTPLAFCAPALNVALKQLLDEALCRDIYIKALSQWAEPNCRCYVAPPLLHVKTEKAAETSPLDSDPPMLVCGYIVMLG